MKTKSLLMAIVLVLAMVPNLVLATSYSTTNRLLVTVNNTDKSLYKIVSPGYVAPVYKLNVQNYAPNGGKYAAVYTVEFGYRSSDINKNELSAIEVAIDSPFFPQSITVPVKPGDQYFTLSFYANGPYQIPVGDSINLTFSAVVNSQLKGADSGDKFQFYLRDIGAEEMWTGAIIKSNFKNTQSDWITIQ